MKKTTTSMPGAALLAAVGLAANEGHHPHKTTGSVARIDKARLEVKDAEGKTQSFVLTGKTRVERGGASAPAASLEAGERVVVEYESAGATRTATSVRVGPSASHGAAQVQAAYVCPMHPEVVSDDPGRCPKCNMLLEKAKGH